MKQPLVSIIIPTKNSAEFLEQCLISIKNQSYKNIEIIVVDNFSKDSTREIAKRYGATIYLKGPERSAQRNYAAKKA
jgi:glycosyltransferase involved in cell wall biosynthesis